MGSLEESQTAVNIAIRATAGSGMVVAQAQLFSVYHKGGRNARLTTKWGELSAELHVKRPLGGKKLLLEVIGTFFLLHTIIRSIMAS